MSEPKNTPGPWKVVDNGHFLQISFPWENNPNVIDRYCRSVADIHNNDIANANLIAAAPDMYEALECACVKYCIGYAGDSLVKCEDCVILKALRKARGELE